MSTPIYRLILSFTVGLAIITGCSKERIEGKEEEENTLNQYNDVSQYLDTKKQQEQEFVIDTPGSGPIQGKEGTKIWISRECLMFPNGDSVTWPFTVALVELYTPKDMIYYQMPTVAAGEILETAGEVRVRAFKDGTELGLKKDCYFIVEMPNAAPKNNMRVYYGFTSGGRPDWTDDLSTLGVSSNVNPLFSASPGGYSGSIAKLGWINCGMVAGNGTGHTLKFTSTTDELKNVGIFVYFPATSSLMQVYNSTSGLVPDGSVVKIVGIGIDGKGKLFAFDDKVTVTSNLNFSVTLNSISDADLTTLLDNL